MRIFAWITVCILFFAFIFASGGCSGGAGVKDNTDDGDNYGSLNENISVPIKESKSSDVVLTGDRKFSSDTDCNELLKNCKAKFDKALARCRQACFQKERKKIAKRLECEEKCAENQSHSTSGCESDFRNCQAFIDNQ